MAPAVMVGVLAVISQNRILFPAMPIPKRVVVMLAALLFVVLPHDLSAQSSGSLKALEAAAAKGNLAAMYALGSAAEASGDVEKALTHFRAAAEAGYAGAEFKLGECYENGRGVAVDVAMAKDWYGRAARQGLPQAVEKLRQLDGSNAAPAVAAAPEATTPNAVAPIAGASVEPLQPANPTAAPAGAPRTVPPAATQSSSPSGSEPGLPNASASAQSSSSTVEIVAFVIPLLVALPMGIMAWKVVRGAVMNWYRSRDFFITGRNAMEMMTKEVGLRLQVEWIPLVAGVAVFVGISVGGWKLFEVLFGVQM